MTRRAFQNTLEDILDVPRNTLNDSWSRDTLESWTSVADMKIFTAITAEFGVEPDGDLLGAETIGDLLGVLEARHLFA